MPISCIGTWNGIALTYQYITNEVLGFFLHTVTERKQKKIWVRNLKLCVVKQFLNFFLSFTAKETSGEEDQFFSCFTTCIS